MVHHYDVQVRTRRNPPLLIALTGPAGCGKTTVTWALLEALTVRSFNDATRVRFAGPLKNMLRSLGLTEAQVDGDEKEVPLALLCGRTSRHAMMTIGTEWGRNLIGADLWVNAAMKQVDDTLAKGVSVVVDDLRFDNEGEALAKRDALIIGLQRTGANYSTDHASEAGIRAGLVHAIVRNDGDVATTVAHILDLANRKKDQAQP